MKVEISKVLDRIGALKFGAFKLTSGKMSPYYIDLRIIPSFPDAFEKICDCFVKFIRSEIGTGNVDRIAGIPVAGIPFASVVAFNLKKPFLYVRKGARFHGRERRIEGIIAPGNRILLMDDLVTTGLSLQKAAKGHNGRRRCGDRCCCAHRQAGRRKRKACKDRREASCAAQHH